MVRLCETASEADRRQAIPVPNPVLREYWFPGTQSMANTDSLSLEICFNSTHAVIRIAVQLTSDGVDAEFGTVSTNYNTNNTICIRRF